MKPFQAVHDWLEIFPLPWPVIWAWIFTAIVVVGIFEPTSFTLTVIKVGGIFLCFWYALITSPRDRLLQLAFLTTFIADIILAVNNTAEVGVLVFLLAQVIHTIRLEGKNYVTQIVSFILLAIASLIANQIWHFAPMMYVICGFYIVAIVTNIYLSWRWWRRQPENLHAGCSFWGFVLFLCCDTCTGISYLSLNGFLPHFLYALANFFAWFFYYPSQVLISNASRLKSTKVPHSLP